MRGKPDRKSCTSRSKYVLARITWGIMKVRIGVLQHDAHLNKKHRSVMGAPQRLSREL